MKEDELAEVRAYQHVVSEATQKRRRFWRVLARTTRLTYVCPFPATIPTVCFLASAATRSDGMFKTRRHAPALTALKAARSLTRASGAPRVPSHSSPFARSFQQQATGHLHPHLWIDGTISTGE